MADNSFDVPRGGALRVSPSGEMRKRYASGRLESGTGYQRHDSDVAVLSGYFAEVIPLQSKKLFCALRR